MEGVHTEGPHARLALPTVDGGLDVLAGLQLGHGGEDLSRELLYLLRQHVQLYLLRVEAEEEETGKAGVSVRRERTHTGVSVSVEVAAWGDYTASQCYVCREDADRKVKASGIARRTEIRHGTPAAHADTHRGPRRACDPRIRRGAERAAW